MKSFLQEVAQELYHRYGSRFSDCSVLFPSRRARLFFIEALSEVAQQPMWQPRWMTIDELMAEVSGLQLGDRLRLVTELYKVYSRYHDESFDKFYFWGDMLLTDFDTIDKYHIDASQLLRNIEDIKELESDLSYLTDRQLEIIRKFWSSLGPDADLTAEKQRFLAIWRTLLPIYNAFREQLSRLGIAYNGMMQRAAADRIKAGEFAFDASQHFVVAGFNALSTCEKILFERMQTTATTDFYWDYDSYYKDHPEQEAGMFIRENIRLFPPAADLFHEGMRQKKELTSIATVSNAVQCKQVASIVRELMREGKLDKETAIVLTDEQLLIPLLYALPAELGKVNVTMGYPLRQTLAYTFIERLIELQAHGRVQGDSYAFYHVDVTGLLSHPFLTSFKRAEIDALCDRIINERLITVDCTLLSSLDPLLATIFRPIKDWASFSQWLIEVLTAVARIPYLADDAARRLEFLAVTSEEINKLYNSLVSCDIQLSVEIYTSLLRRHLQTVRVPFEGEPLEGVQVMGILETRNLDFKHVIILSMADATFPGSHLTQSSFIPYSLRAAYDLPTPEHHEGVYAYYFYRLIQRAERVWMLYCSRADEKSTGEQSRYIRQLDYESGLRMRKIEVGVDLNLVDAEPIVVEKDDGIMAQLLRYTDDAPTAAVLSPTALYRYVACPLRFYFHTIAHLRSEEELCDELDAPMFGTILHAAIQELYGSIEGQPHPRKALEAMRQGDTIRQVVDRAIATHYLRNPQAGADHFTGNLLLVRNIVTRYLKGGVIPYDAAHDNFMVWRREHEVSYRFPFVANGRSYRMNFSGIADRIDRMDDGRIRVVDYKTGAPHLEFDGVESLFNGSADQRQSNILQTLLYAMMLCRSEGRDALPTLYYVRQMHLPEYSPLLIDNELNIEGISYAGCADSFEHQLRQTLAELFDPSVPFTQCSDAKSCTYCDFKEICRR